MPISGRASGWEEARSGQADSGVAGGMAGDGGISRGALWLQRQNRRGAHSG